VLQLMGFDARGPQLAHSTPDARRPLQDPVPGPGSRRALPITPGGSRPAVHGRPSAPRSPTWAPCHSRPRPYQQHFGSSSGTRRQCAPPSRPTQYEATPPSPRWRFFVTSRRYATAQVAPPLRLFQASAGASCSCVHLRSPATALTATTGSARGSPRLYRLSGTGATGASSSARLPRPSSPTDKLSLSPSDMQPGRYASWLGPRCPLGLHGPGSLRAICRPSLCLGHGHTESQSCHPAGGSCFAEGAWCQVHS